MDNLREEALIIAMCLQSLRDSEGKPLISLIASDDDGNKVKVDIDKKEES